MWQQLGSRPIEELVDLPLMTDPDWRATMDVLAELMPPALFTDDESALPRHRAAWRISAWSTATATDRASPMPGSACCSGHASATTRRASASASSASIWSSSAGSIASRRARLSWSSAIRHALDEAPAQPASACCGAPSTRRSETGDLTFAAYSCNNLITHLLARGDPLDEVQREAENGARVRPKDAVRPRRRHHRPDSSALIRTLRGLTPAFGVLQRRRVRRGPVRAAAWQAIRAWPMPAAGTGSASCRRASLPATIAAAVAAATKAQRLLSGHRRASHLRGRRIPFLRRARAGGALRCRARRASGDSISRRSAAHHEQLADWARELPGELRGPRGAGRRRDRAPRRPGARRQAAVRRGHPLGARERFRPERGHRQRARRALLRGARLRDDRRRLSAQCARLLPALGRRRQGPAARPGATRTCGRSRHRRVRPARSARRSSSWISRPSSRCRRRSPARSTSKKLIETLMVIALEHAGAERGLLILPRGDELRIEAEATTGRDTVEVTSRQARSARRTLPESVLRYVMRTQESVMLDDASDANPFSGRRVYPPEARRSVLCLPLVKQAQADRRALPREQPDAARVHAGADRGAEAAGLAGRDLAGECPSLLRELRHTRGLSGGGAEVSRTGSFGWNVSSGEIFWSDETFRIFELDRTTVPTLET